MRQRYTIVKDPENQQLIIKEYGELDKDIMSLLCEEVFEDQVVVSAMAGGKASLAAALRTENMYPPAVQAEKIAEAVMSIYDSKEAQSVDIVFDDKEALAKAQEEAEAAEEVGEEVDLEISDDSDELDELLDDADMDLKKTASSLRMADDDASDLEEDN